MMGDYRLTVLTPFPSLQAPGSRFLLLSLWFSVLRAYPKNCNLFACGVIALRAAGLFG